MNMMMVTGTSSSSYWRTEFGVILMTGSVMVTNGMTVSFYKASKSAKLRRFLESLTVFCVALSGLEELKKCSYLLVP